MSADATLALDAATERLSVALRVDGDVHELHLDGPRRHAREVLGMIDALLAARGCTPRDVRRVISGDGPGSFTGLRVASAVAKALVWGRPDVEWWTAPSLLARAVRAATHSAGPEGSTVLAVSDALRGELYAGCWRFEGGGVTAVGPRPRAVAPADLGQFGPLDAVVGTIPVALLDAVREATGRDPITGEAALPSAEGLLDLAAWRGGLSRVDDSAGWHPEYGRPAEAQAVWERKHGRRLPDSTHRPG